MIIPAGQHPRKAASPPRSHHLHHTKTQKMISYEELRIEIK
jgi:hypothetical protein